MATHRSAEKRHRQNRKRRERNRRANSAIRTAVKSALTLAEGKEDHRAVVEAVRRASRLLDKAVVHGVMHKKTAARHISRLQKLVNSLRAS